MRKICEMWNFVYILAKQWSPFNLPTFFFFFFYFRDLEIFLKKLLSEAYWDISLSLTHGSDESCDRVGSVACKKGSGQASSGPN